MMKEKENETNGAKDEIRTYGRPWYYGMQQRTSLLGAWGVRMGPWG